MNHFNMMDQATIPVFMATLTDGFMSAIPAAPTDLIATAINMHRVDLAWTDNASNETGFWVERALVTDGIPGAFASIGMAAVDATSFSDLSAAANTTYAYRVFAFNVHGDSLPSNEAVATTLGVQPAEPTSLTAAIQASLKTGPRVRLVFRDNAFDETGFVVERSDNGGDFASIANLLPRAKLGNVTYTDTSVLGGQQYVYRVFAVKGNTPSAYSNTAIAILPPVPAAPSGFIATVQVTGGGATARVNMIWNDLSNNESRFVIQRATDANFTANVVSFNRGANSTAWANTGLPRGTTFYYRIRAENQYGVSVWVLLTPFPIVTP
jgi:hypothetical protein